MRAHINAHLVMMKEHACSHDDADAAALGTDSHVTTSSCTSEQQVQSIGKGHLTNAEGGDRCFANQHEKGAEDATRTSGTTGTVIAATAAAATAGTGVNIFRGSSSSHADAEGGADTSPAAGSVSNESSLLKQHGKFMAELLELSQELSENVQAAVYVLNDILDYDKIETGQLQFDPSLLAVQPLVTQTAALFDLQAEAKGLSLVVDMSCDGINSTPADPELSYAAGLFLLADESQIVRVLRNLVSSAIKFTPSGGTVTVETKWESVGLPRVKSSIKSLHIPVAGASCSSALSVDNGDGRAGAFSNEVSSSAVCRAGALVLTVTDTGVGLTKDQVESVFSEGAQFNRNRLQGGGGSGLGLSIAKGVHMC